DGVLIGGDHLLRPITPAIGLYPESRPDPPGDYLASLARTIELAPRIAYPGHGEPIEDAAQPAAEVLEHHRERLAVDAAPVAAAWLLLLAGCVVAAESGLVAARRTRLL